MSSKKVLTRGSLQIWDLALLLILSVAGLVWAVVLFSQRSRDLAIGVGAIAVTVLIASVVGLRLRVQNRQWVQDLADGWLLIDPSGERRIDDSQVFGMTFDVTKNYQNGLFVSVTRRLSFWFNTPGSEPECVRMTNTMRAGMPDPLTDLIRRISNRLLTNAQTDLAEGRPVHGETWTLDGEKLEVHAKGASSQAPFSTIAAVNEVDGHLCVWRHNDEAASIRIPVDSINAWLLGQLLVQCLADRTEKA